MQVKSTSQFLRVRVIAARLDVSVATIYRAIESGKLPAVRVGSGRGALRVPAGAVDAYVASCQSSGGDAA
ncbi:excisionase family DNA-binding protein [Actinophytocola sp.]|uniref:excisionase family DNA-binding protein n=1 Tax=Actinophytocola sp. TaxID=1872138 RepID=UPI002ED3B416